MEPRYFKVGMTVYHWWYGEGMVSSINYNPNYPVGVDFGMGIFGFTSDGRLLENQPKTLSQTPYNMSDGGFTLIPIE